MRVKGYLPVRQPIIPPVTPSSISGFGKLFLPMPLDIPLPGHELLLCRVKDRAVVEGQDVAGDVGVGFGDGGLGKPCRSRI